MSNTPIQLLLDRVRARNLKLKKSKDGWTCQCPAHEDRNPSLSIGTGADGRVLLNCFTGCTAEAVCKALDLRLADLFPTTVGTKGRSVGGKALTVTPRSSAPRRKEAGQTFNTAEDAVKDWERRIGRPSDHQYVYESGDGESVGAIVRWDKPDGKREDIRPVSRTSDGSGWVKLGMSEPCPLYHLPELLASPHDTPVWVCEGEKATDAARSLGFLATTSPHGCQSAAKADWSPVRDRDVVISVDNDRAGEQYGAAVARLCHAAGAQSVRIVRLKSLWAEIPKGGDMADFVEHRGGDVDSIRTEVEALADRAEPVTATKPLANRSATGVSSPSHVLATFQRFPLDALPRVMREYIAGAAKRMDAEPAMIATPTLAIFAAAIGNSARILIKSAWTEPSCLWTGVIALPGSMKSQTQAAAALPMQAAQRQADLTHDEKVKAYAIAVERYNEAKKSRRSTPAEGPVEPEPEEPARWQCLTQDATPEALVGVLAKNPRGVVNLWDELGGLFGSFGRYSRGGSNASEPGSAFYKSAYTGSTYTENRKGPDSKGRYVRLESPLVSVTGAIQPEALKRILLRQYLDDGLASRFLFCWPPDRPGGWVEDELVDDSALVAYSAAYEALLGIPLHVDESTGKLEPILVGLSAEAKVIARAWVDGVQDRVRNAPDAAVRAARAKLKGGMFRIALVIHMTEWASNGIAPFGNVSADTLQRAVRIAEWFDREAGRVYGMLSESESDNETRRIIDWIKAQGGAVTVRDLTRGPARFRSDAAASEQMLNELAAHGLGRWVSEPGPNGGRPTDRFYLTSETPESSDGDETLTNPED